MRYKIYCTHEEQWLTNESLLVREVCPNDANHAVLSGSLAIIIPDSNNCTKDYKVLRKELIEYVIENQETLTVEELQVASENFSVPTEVRDQFYTIEEQIELGKSFHRNSCKSRDKRYNAAVAELFNRLSYPQTYAIIQDLNTGNLIWNYINLGVEGTSEGDDVGVYDFFLSTSGTVFQDNGFLQKGWEPIGMTLQELSDKVLDILKNGNY